MMNDRAVVGWTAAALLGTAHWFFGNLYEAVVISPNWVGDGQVARLDDFLATTGPTLYFVPFNQLTLLLVGVLWWATRHDDAAVHFRRAGLWGLALGALTTVIVAAVLPRLFGADVRADPGSAMTAAWVWNTLNVLRLVLSGLVGAHLARAIRAVERRRAVALDVAPA